MVEPDDVPTNAEMFAMVRFVGVSSGSMPEGASVQLQPFMGKLSDSPSAGIEVDVIRGNGEVPNETP